MRVAPSLVFYGSDPMHLLRVPLLYIQYCTCLLHPFNELSGSVDYMKMSLRPFKNMLFYFCFLVLSISGNNIMKYVRWYDKDPDLSSLMSFLESLNEDVRDEIAQDLIQIILSEIKANTDGEISHLNENKITEYKRWYDKNLSLHSAVEIIKNLNDEQRKEIISLIMESIVQILTEYNYEKNEE